MIDVVGIYIGHYVSGGFIKPLLQGVVQASVPFACPISQLIFMLPDYVHGIIGAAAINNDVFQIRIILPKHREDGLLKIVSLIKGRSHNADFGIVHC